MIGKGCVRPSAWLLSFIFIGVSYAGYSQELFYQWAHSVNINGSGFVSFGRLGGHAVATDASGNVFVSGNFSGTIDLDPTESTASFTSGSADGDDWFLVKYDAKGNYLWGFAAGGTSSDAVYNLAIDADGNVVVAGTFRSTMDLDPSPDGSHIVGLDDPLMLTGQAFMAKYSPDGKLLWGNAFVGERCTLTKMTMDADYNIYVAGGIRGTIDLDPSADVANMTAPGTSDISYVAKYDQDGRYLWAMNFGTGATYGLVCDHGQNLYVTGSFRKAFDADPSPTNQVMMNPIGDGSAFVAKYSSAGAYQWAKQFGDNVTDIAFSVITDEYDNAYVYGSKDNADFLIKYAPDGQSPWSFSLSGTNASPSNLFSHAIELAEDNSFYIAGSINRTTIDFDPSSGVFQLSGIKKNDGFLAQYTYDGQLVMATALPSDGTLVSAISVNAHHEVLLTGAFSGTLDLDLSPRVANVECPATGGAFFVSKYKTCISTPQFAGQQFNEAVCVGSTTAFVADAGEGTYQWFKNGAEFVRPGTAVDAGTLELAQAQLEDEGVYHVEFVDACYNSLVSDDMPLHVIAPVVITTNPQDIAIENGETFVLQGAATGENVTYAWSKNDIALEDAHAATYEVEHAVGMDAGTYFFTASNRCNTETSATAHVVMLLDVVMGNEEPSPDTFNYVNPVANTFTFSFDKVSQGPIDVVIYGAQGSLTYRTHVNGGDTNAIDASQWPSGFYYFTARYGNQQTNVKLVKP